MVEESYCLVLSGGGAKGVFHMGVWKALKELDIRLSAVIGNSVGAIIGAFIVMDKYDEALSILSDIGLDDIVELPETLHENGELKVRLSNIKSWIEFRKVLFAKEGLDTTPLQKILEQHVDEDEIRKRGLDFGLVTYNLDELRPIRIFFEQIEPGFLAKYILASSTVPGFKMTEIKNEKYIDGGVYDNIPFSMAKARGYKKIIVVDISGLGRKRKLEVEGTQTTYIKNSIGMGGLLDFDKKFLYRYTELGYLDTLKTFGVLTGWKYFFEKDDELCSKIETILGSSHYQAAAQKYLAKNNISFKGSFEQTMRLLLPEELRLQRKLIYPMADCAAAVLKLERIKRYSFEDLLDSIYKAEKKISRRISLNEKKMSRFGVIKLVQEITELAHNGVLTDLGGKSPRFYERLIDEVLGSYRSRLPFSTIEYLFSGLHAGSLFILAVMQLFEG